MVGFIAACLTTFGFVPQVIKVLKTKETESISLGMYVLSVTGMCLCINHCQFHFCFLSWDYSILQTEI